MELLRQIALESARELARQGFISTADLAVIERHTAGATRDCNADHQAASQAA